MPDVLRIKRRLSGGAGAPAALANAEIAYNEVDNTLYYGKGGTAVAAASIVPIAGPGSYLPLTGGTMTGDLILNRDPVSANMAATGHYVTATLSGYLPLNGGTMTGILNMNNQPLIGIVDPPNPFDAANKNYVDNGLALKAPVNSPAFTGTPTTPTPAAADSSTNIANTTWVRTYASGAFLPLGGGSLTGNLNGLVQPLARVNGV